MIVYGRVVLGPDCKESVLDFCSTLLGTVGHSCKSLRRTALLITLSFSVSGGSCCWTGTVGRHGAGEQAVNAMLDVVIPEFGQLARRVDDIPEKYLIKVFASNRSDCSVTISRKWLR